jgi:hypothetical protein
MIVCEVCCELELCRLLRLIKLCDLKEGRGPQGLTDIAREHRVREKKTKNRKRKEESMK